MESLVGPVTVLERAPGRFSVTGEIDLATAARLDELEYVHGPLLLDLHGVTFMDSSGIAALVRLHQRCPHRDCHVPDRSLLARGGACPSPRRAL